MENSKQKPGRLHSVCAYPVQIVCGIGALVLDGLCIWWLASEGMTFAELLAPVTLCWLVLALIPITGLGFFAGMFTIWPFVRVICSRFNGSPFTIGDEVRILRGDHKGIVATVYEMPQSQGGWNMVRLQLDPEKQEKYQDLFEEFAVLRQ